MSMTTAKLREAFLACEKIISKQAERVGTTMAIRDMEATSEPGRISHLLWMAREGLQLIEDNRREKAMRWLGFLQGVLWQSGWATVAQLKDMNRPEGSEHDAERV